VRIVVIAIVVVAADDLGHARRRQKARVWVVSRPVRAAQGRLAAAVREGTLLSFRGGGKNGSSRDGPTAASLCSGAVPVQLRRASE
jgi:hypothetical protein